MTVVKSKMAAAADELCEYFGGKTGAKSGFKTGTSGGKVRGGGYRGFEMKLRAVVVISAEETGEMRGF